MKVEIKSVFVTEFIVRDEKLFESHPLISRMLNYSDSLGIEAKTPCGAYCFVIGDEEKGLAFDVFRELPKFLDEHLANAKCEVEGMLFVDGVYDRRYCVKIKQKNTIKVIHIHEKSAA
jgi:hypothetical protein